MERGPLKDGWDPGKLRQASRGGCPGPEEQCDQGQNEKCMECPGTLRRQFGWSTGRRLSKRVGLESVSHRSDFGQDETATCKPDATLCLSGQNHRPKSKGE